MCLTVIKCYVIFFFMLPLALYGQETKNFGQELEILFKNMRPAERKELIGQSVETWGSSFLTGTEKDSLNALFLELQSLKITVDPELRNFLMCVNSFRIRNEKENMNVWINGLKKTLGATDRKRTVVRNYLVSTTPFVCDRILKSISGHNWLVRGQGEWVSGDEIRIHFKDVELVCKTLKDSISVYHTTISYILGDDWILGQEGTVKWRNSADSLWATLAGYRIDLKSSEYTADSVWFYYETKFGKPVLGKLKDNASKYDRGENRPYPEFLSYDLDIAIDGLFPKISYRGGVMYAGVKFSGFGSEEQPARLYIVPNDTISMEVYSRKFNVDSARIMSGTAGISIKMDSGAITHTDVNFLYMAARNLVTVKRITEQSLLLPFKDSYHRILFDMEEIIWPLDSNQIEMRMGSRSGLFKGKIESLNFFSDDVYDNIQGLDEINPLNGLLKCSIEQKSNVFTVGDYAEFIKKPADQLRKQIVLLSYGDFVDYNETRDEVTLKQRLFDYTKARAGKQDYDNIRFESHPKGQRTNALLDTRNFNLKIFGVDKFTISKTKDVYVEPSDHSVVMMKNRDMLFNGKLKAGMFDMYGTNLFFSYDKYTIQLEKVDSANMYMAGQNTNLRGEKVKSLIRDVKGNIVIDKPDNKSGKKKDSGFPILNSTKESYVYFDDPLIQDGKYRRDSFYYVIKPYSIKEINDASKFRYAFDGTLVSNIVPPIEDTLRLMKDRTMGIVYKTPPSGVKLYNKGLIRSDITLDQRGFMAKGDVEMNQSKFQSDTILMLLDCMTANTKMINVSAVNGQRPEAKGEQVIVKYVVASGNLQATSIHKPFDIYKGRIKHNGTLFVYQDVMDADGKLELKDAQLQSKLFNLKADNILSKRTDLRISSISNKEIQLITNNVSADIDLINNKGAFVNNEATNKAVFSSSRYACTFKRFTWYMEESYLNIGMEEEKELAAVWKTEDIAKIPEQGRNVFISTNRATDSLRFVAPLARYDLNSGNIDCRWVNHIDIANGRFYPDKGNIFIKGEGGIKELTAGRLLCERMDSTKQLTDVTLNLVGKNKFSGSGNFKYVSEEQKETVIRFAEIAADTVKLIYAKAAMTPETPLLLNSGFNFKGKITLHSRQKDLFFKGAVSMTSDKDYLKHTWMEVSCYLQSQSIRIPVKAENRDDNKQRIFNGIFLGVDKTIKPYASFQSIRTFYNDDMLIGGAGLLQWSKELKQYIIRDTSVNRHYYFRYDPDKYLISAFGKLNLTLAAPGIYQNAAGDISYSLKEEKLDITNVLYMIDFMLPAKVEAILLKDFTDKKQKVIQVGASLNEKIYCIYGKEQMPLVAKQLERSSNNVPDSLNTMLVIDSLHLKWNQTTRSYIAGDLVRVVSIHGKPVEKTMNIKMELVRRSNGNEIFVYLYDDSIWYYFEYAADKNLYTLSSNQEYNDVLKNEKADNKVVRTEGKETLYTVTLCPDSKRERFLKRVK